MIRVRMGQEDGLDSSPDLDQVIDLPAQVSHFFGVPGAGVDHVQGVFADDQAIRMGRRRNRRALDGDERDPTAEFKPVVLPWSPLGSARQQREGPRQLDGRQLPQGIGHGRGEANLAAMPAGAGFGWREPIERDDFALDELLVLVAAHVVQEVPRVEADGRKVRRHPLPGSVEIVGVDREGLLREEVGEVQLFREEAAASVLDDFERRERPSHAQKPGLLEDFSRSGLNRAGLLLIWRIGDATDALACVHPAAGEHMMPAHETQRGIPPRQQDLGLAVAPHEDAGGRWFWFDGHRSKACSPKLTDR